jgi:hypothetical protein
MSSNPRISSMIIAILIVGFFVSSLAYIISSFAVNYNPNENINISSMNKMEQLRNNAESIKGNITKISANDNWLSKLDGFFSAGWGTAKISMDSVQVTESIIDESIDHSNIGFIGENLKILIITIIIILVFVGIFLSVLLRREM